MIEEWKPDVKVKNMSKIKRRLKPNKTNETKYKKRKVINIFNVHLHVQESQYSLVHIIHKINTTKILLIINCPYH